MSAIRMVSVVLGMALIVVCNARSVEKEEALALLKQTLLRRLVYGEARADLSVDGRTDDGVSDAVAKRIVDLHNQLRVNESASNMNRLRWEPKLAQLAQEWANRCTFEHRSQSSYNANTYGFPSVGENIWAYSADTQTIPDKPIMDWFNEKDYYNFNNGACSKEPCGHYPQVVGANSVAVGCGFKKCPTLTIPGQSSYTNGVFFVCNYGPHWGSGKPYKKGRACTECDSGVFLCTGELCDSTCTSKGTDSCQCKANCRMCSNVTDSCTCKCRPGFTGPICLDRCEDKNPKCGVNGQWPEMACTSQFLDAQTLAAVNKECPKMCKRCEPFDPSLKCTQRAGEFEKLDTAEIEFLINELENSVDRK